MNHYSLQSLTQGTEIFKEYKIARIVKQIQELSSVLMHHDTITGTSPSKVIKNTVDKIESMTLREGMLNAEIVNSKIERVQGLKVDGLDKCSQIINQPK